MMTKSYVGRRASSISQVVSSRMVEGELEQGDVCVRIAHNLSMFEDAFRTAYDIYHDLGFIPASESRLRISPYQLYRNTIVFVAYRNGRPAATLSLYPDGPNGLPSDAGWKDDLDGLRSPSRSIAELGALIIRPNESNSLRTCLEMFRNVWVYTQKVMNINMFCAFVQGKHAKFYRRVLKFTRFGSPKYYKWCGLNVKDITPFYLDLAHAEDIFSAAYYCREKGVDLYRDFTEDRGKDTAAVLREDAERLRAMDWNTFLSKFSAHAPVPRKERIGA